MEPKTITMKKILTLLSLALLLAGCAYAHDANVEINGTEFELPSAYQGGELSNGKYELENNFSIRCVDGNVAKAIGLWAEEQDFSEDLSISKHPVRHFCQYNKYVNGNQSHAYFATGQTLYEITWTGKEINKDIEKLIKNTPPSEINDDDFYNALDLSYEIYKQDKIDRLNQDGEYNYLDAKLHSSLSQDTSDNTKLNEILFTYYLNR